VDEGDVEVYYYGCRNETGHYWHARDGEWMKQNDIINKVPPSIGPHKVDCGFCPDPHTKPGRIPRGGPQGDAAFHHVDGWSILSFWDNSVDSRPGSCSTFVARGTFGYDTMREIAKAQFPSVWNRFKFDIKLVEEHLG